MIFGHPDPSFPCKITKITNSFYYIYVDTPCGYVRVGNLLGNFLARVGNFDDSVLTRIFLDFLVVLQ